VPELPVVLDQAVTSLADPGQGPPASADPSGTTERASFTDDMVRMVARPRPML